MLHATFCPHTTNCVLIWHILWSQMLLFWVTLISLGETWYFALNSNFMHFSFVFKSQIRLSSIHRMLKVLLLLLLLLLCQVFTSSHPPYQLDAKNTAYTLHTHAVHAPRTCCACSVHAPCKFVRKSISPHKKFGHKQKWSKFLGWPAAFSTVLILNS